MSGKILITLLENEVAPRFDLATEVLIVTIGGDDSIEDSRTMVLAHASAEDLCQLILAEDIDAVICGGIEEEFFDYLIWKKVQVLDSVMGPWDRALDSFQSGTLKSGAILFERPERKSREK